MSFWRVPDLSPCYLPLYITSRGSKVSIDSVYVRALLTPRIAYVFRQ